MLAHVGYERLSPIATPIEVKPVLDYVQQVRTLDPNDPQLLAENVDLRFRYDTRYAACALLKASLTDSPEMLYPLSMVDRSDQLGATKALTDRAMACKAATPEQALDQIRVFAIAGDIASAQKFLAGMQSHSSPDWKLAWLQAREALHDDAVGSAWGAVC